MTPEDLPPVPPNGSGGLWTFDGTTMTPVVADDAPVSPPSDDE
jgi:hypothetical protein